MNLKPSEIFEVLKNKGIFTLYHADTVITSCSFLKKGYLLSRGELEKLQLPMTDQQSDAQDKKFGLWYDVFVDGIDIHDRIKKRNYYGPVLLCIDSSVLIQKQISSIKVTKSNPQSWNDNISEKEIYFQNINEFKYGYNYGDFQKMFVIPKGSGVVRFNKYLRRIVVDYISLNGTHYYAQALKVLKSAAEKGGVSNIKIERRNCADGCKCDQEYQRMTPATLQKFFGLSSN